MRARKRSAFLGGLAVYACADSSSPVVVLQETGEGEVAVRLRTADLTKEVARRVTFDEMDFARYPLTNGAALAQEMLAELRGGA